VIRYPADTNVLLRWVVPGDPLGDVARTAVKRLAGSPAALHVCGQNLVEFWSVATRPRAANGLGMKPTEVAAEIDRVEAMFLLLEETPRSTATGVGSWKPTGSAGGRFMMHGSRPSWRCTASPTS
jgi:predicted nucleic acid-binding protein